MRTFTDLEQELMQFVVSQKINKDFHSLEIAKIIRSELDILAIRRNPKSVILCNNLKIKNEAFFKLADILSLIKELEYNNLIVISHKYVVYHNFYYSRPLP